MHSWKQRTRQRYGSAIHQLAEFETCIPSRPLPEVLSLCMAERAADGHSASRLRGLASAVRAAEDLALVPRVVAALHWRIAKSRRGPGPQAYVSPRALVHIWNAATAPDDRAVAALAALSWTMWLRVVEAASIRYCDLGRKEGLWFYSTKVGEPGWVCRPSAAYASSWMEFLQVYCKAKGKRPDEPIFEGGAPFLEDGISRLLRDSKWADARWHALRRGGSAACYVRKPAAQHFLFWGRWAGLRTAMGYALGFRDPEVVGDLVLPHVDEAVGLGPRGTVLPGAMWGLAMYDLSRCTEPPMEPPHPSPTPLLVPAGGSLVEDVPEAQGVTDASVDRPPSCPSPAVQEPLSEPQPTSSSPPCTQSAPPELPLEIIILSDSDSDEDVGDGSGVRKVVECVPKMGSVTAPADAFRVGTPGPGGVESRKRPREPGPRGQQCVPPPPLSGSTVCLPRPGYVTPMRLPRMFGSSAFCPRGGFPKLRSARPVGPPRLVRVLPPVVGFPPPQVGVGGRGLAPGLRDLSRTPTGSEGEAGSSARQRLAAVAVGCAASNAAPSAPPRTWSDGRARLWAVRKLVEGGGRWSRRWRLTVAGEQPLEQAVEVGQPPRGVGASYAWRPPGETSGTVEQLRTQGTVVLARAEGLGAGGGRGRCPAPPCPTRARLP